MKVIFLEDVPNVAKTGEIKEMADGYVRNYLLPRRLATPATPGAVKDLERELKIRSRKEAQTEAELAALAQQLESKEVTLKAQAGSKERLYGSITAADIAAELEKNGINVDKRKIELSSPIRQLGSYEVPVKLSRDLVPKIRVIVVEQETEAGGQPEAPAA